MSKPLIELFSAKWCGHCKNFKPNWAELKKISDIECQKYEQTNVNDKEHFETNKVQSFPTIYITVNGNKEKYEGNRTVNDIMNYICNKTPNQKDCAQRYPTVQAGGKCGCQISQSGGNCNCKTGGNKKSKKTKNVDDAKYELKYYKYKAKYLKIKDK